MTSFVILFPSEPISFIYLVLSDPRTHKQTSTAQEHFLWRWPWCASCSCVRTRASREKQANQNQPEYPLKAKRWGSYPESDFRVSVCAVIASEVPALTQLESVLQDNVVKEAEHWTGDVHIWILQTESCLILDAAGDLHWTPVTK